VPLLTGPVSPSKAATSWRLTARPQPCAAIGSSLRRGRPFVVDQVTLIERMRLVRDDIAARVTALATELTTR
jgi:hypothetical protein